MAQRHLVKCHSFLPEELAFEAPPARHVLCEGSVREEDGHGVHPNAPLQLAQAQLGENAMVPQVWRVLPPGEDVGVQICWGNAVVGTQHLVGT
eukprot:scaffold3545_cov105-Phaeocystis_antarctica.AAC.2